MFFSDTFSNSVLTAKAVGDHWVALNTSDPGLDPDTAMSTEIFGGGYRRQKGSFALVGDREVMVSETLTFPSMPDCEIAWFSVWDAEKGGNLLFTGMFSGGVTVTVAEGQGVSVPANSVGFSLLPTGTDPGCKPATGPIPVTVGNRYYAALDTGGTVNYNAPVAGNAILDSTHFMVHAKNTTGINDLYVCSFDPASPANPTIVQRVNYDDTLNDVDWDYFTGAGGIVQCCKSLNKAHFRRCSWNGTTLNHPGISAAASEVVEVDVPAGKSGWTQGSMAFSKISDSDYLGVVGLNNDSTIDATSGLYSFRVSWNGSAWTIVREMTHVLTHNPDTNTAVSAIQMFPYDGNKHVLLAKHGYPGSTGNGKGDWVHVLDDNGEVLSSLQIRTVAGSNANRSEDYAYSQSFSNGTLWSIRANPHTGSSGANSTIDVVQVEIDGTTITKKGELLNVDPDPLGLNVGDWGVGTTNSNGTVLFGVADDHPVGDESLCYVPLHDGPALGTKVRLADHPSHDDQGNTDFQYTVWGGVSIEIDALGNDWLILPGNDWYENAFVEVVRLT